MKFSFLVLMLCATIMCQEREYPPQDMSPHPVFATNSYAYAFQRAMLRKEHEQKLLDQRNQSRVRAMRLRSHAQAAQAKL